MAKYRVGVLRGGPSSEYEVSLNTGASVLRALSTERYVPREVFIDRQGVWHVMGMPVEPPRALENLDAVFIALHGAYGEDGTVQRLLDSFAIPYTGSGALASSLGMNKVLAKQHAERAGMRVPLHTVVDRSITEQGLLRLFRSFPQPSIVKPVSGGSSVGVTRATSYEQMQNGILDVLEKDETALVEEYVSGREATVGIIEGFRGEALYALPPIEVLPGESPFFDYHAKYRGGAQEICPARFPHEVSRALEDSARAIHRTLGLRHYSRSDFIVTSRGIYFLEVNTLPGLTEASLIPKAVEAVGARFPDVVDHLVELALASRSGTIARTGP